MTQSVPMSDPHPYKPASAVIPGDLVAEADGAFFQVTAVAPAPRDRVAITLANINHYRSAAPEFTVTVRRAAQVRVVAAPVEG